jgi:hypothetical protein
MKADLSLWIGPDQRVRVSPHHDLATLHLDGASHVELFAEGREGRLADLDVFEVFARKILAAVGEARTATLDAIADAGAAEREVPAS